MQLKTAVRAGGLHSVNHNEAVVTARSVLAGAETDRAAAEVEQNELETLADALRVRTGLNTGAPKPFVPCV